MSAGPVDVVLFDLGGVLFDFGGVESMKVLAGIDDDEEIWRRWLACRWVRSFERGGCTVEDFGAGVVDDWSLAISPDEYVDAFRSWVGGPLDGADALVRDTARSANVGCLSNTNELHWSDHDGQWDVLQALEYTFLSFRMGCVKPDREIFDRAVEVLGVAPDRVLFLDDNAINVEAAIAAGWQSERTVGVDAARQCLAARGLVEQF
jgi:putative hydrolase of the HAD superfamily